MKLRTANKIMSRLKKADKHYDSFNEKFPLGTNTTKKIYSDFHRLWLRCRSAQKRWDKAFERIQKYKRLDKGELAFRLLFNNMGHNTYKKLRAKSRSRKLTESDLKKRYNI